MDIPWPLERNTFNSKRLDVQYKFADSMQCRLHAIAS